MAIKMSGNFRKGFSLVEMLIYIAILALMLSVIMNIIVSTVRSERVIKVLRNVEDSAILSLERIVRETRQAESVNLVSSDLGSNPGKLVLTDALGSPRAEFYLSSGRLFLKENGVDVGALT